MYPVLFKIPIFGGITIYSYGVMVATGFLVAILWIMHESKRVGLNTSKSLDLVFYIIVSAIIGSRVLHVLTAERERFLSDPLIILKFWEPGLVFYGGLIASLIVGIWYVKRNKMPLLPTCDMFAPAIAIGHSVGRIGCFLAGCCFGRVCENSHWYSVVFPTGGRSFAPGGIPLYPTQLMESAGEFLIFIILVLLRKVKHFEGQVIATYLMLYAVVRSFNELFRGDAERGFVIEPWISTSQFISIFMFAVGAIMYARLWKRGKENNL